jgi:hypothetical protein
LKTRFQEGAILDHDRPPRIARTLTWQISARVCALSDWERHIGHVVRIGGCWHAFDATHSNEKGNGFQSLGTFAAVESARHAVEQSYRPSPRKSFAGAA